MNQILLPFPPHDDADAKPIDASLDKLINAKTLRHKVLFSMQHIYRLEAAGQFPARVHIGPARVGWPLSDVTAWMQEKLEARGPCPFNPDSSALISSDDRFVGKKELKGLALYSPQHVRLLELEGLFPKRIQIGENRVAWLEREITHWLKVRHRLFKHPKRQV